MNHRDLDKASQYLATYFGIDTIDTINVLHCTMRMCVHLCTWVCVCAMWVASVCVYVYLLLCTNINVYRYVHIYTGTHTYTRTHAHMHKHNLYFSSSFRSPSVNWMGSLGSLEFIVALKAIASWDTWTMARRNTAQIEMLINSHLCNSC